MKARVASVHFARLYAERLYGGKFALPAVPLNGEAQIIEIEAHRQTEQGGYSTSNDRKKRSVHRYIIEAMDIARDIVNQWAHNGLGMLDGQRPGVWVVRDFIPELNADGAQMIDADGKGAFREATPQEQKTMFAEDLVANRKADVEYARWCVMEGNRIAQDVRTIQFIPERYKLAAKYLGMETAWMKPTSATLEMKTCEYCTSVIPKKAVVCPKCQQITDFEEFGRLEAQKAMAVKKASLKVG
jgi:hypothetical protein